MLALLAPGQGAQTPGFLAPWLDLPAVADQVRWFSAVVGLDLVRLGTSADADEIRNTAVAQPLLVAAGLAAADALLEHEPATVAPLGVAAGHSVGELTAAAVAGALSAEAALVLVRERGRAMAAAVRPPAAATPSGMTAVLGGDPTAVAAALAAHGLTAANENGPGQVVAAGPVAGLAALAADPPAGARLRPLAVAGAFHTSVMAPARAALAALAPGVPVRDPHTPWVSNADGALVRHGRDLLDRLVRQVAAPVRWDLCLRTLGELRVTAVVELPPAGTLVGLTRRALPGVTTVALTTPDDLAPARHLIAAQALADPDTTAPAWRLVVAPVAGTFRIEAPAEPGARLAPGAPVGTVLARRGHTPVTAPYGGTLVEWLVADGDPVAPGQPLARLHPVAVVA